MYAAAGIGQHTEPVVGIGSVCRRQGTAEVAAIITALAERGIRLHGFGIKAAGLANIADDIRSADSMAWSTRGRHLPGCTDTHASEANCLRFALRWRARLLGTTSATRNRGGVARPARGAW